MSSQGGAGAATHLSEFSGQTQGNLQIISKLLSAAVPTFMVYHVEVVRQWASPATVRRPDGQLEERTMTPEQIAVMQGSFQRVATFADQAAKLFYQHLFLLDPQLKSLFPSDMHAQGRKLVQMIGLAVHRLNSPETLIPAVQELGNGKQCRDARRPAIPVM
jgi:Globin